MKVCAWNSAFLVLILFSGLQSIAGIRFVLDREECLSQKIPYEKDKVLVSFVVVKEDVHWRHGDPGLDFVVKGPMGEIIHSSHGKTNEKFDFLVRNKGLHRFCFTNKSPYHETIDFDVHVSHFTHYDPHAKDKDLAPLHEQMAKLGESLQGLMFEQHWMYAGMERKTYVNEGMSNSVVEKALLESAALVTASVLQVYLLRRLFDKKLGMPRF